MTDTVTGAVTDAPALAGGHTGPRFLIVRLGALGDVVHAIPVAAALRSAYPSARIDWMIDPRYVDVVRMVTAVDHAVPIDPRASVVRLFGSLSELRRRKYTAAIDLQGLLKSAGLARMAGAGRTIGFPQEHLREPMARAFYSDAPELGAAPHVVHKNLALLRGVGIEVGEPAFPLEVPRTPALEVAQGRVGAGPFAVINPGAAWPNKRWPPERFGAVAAAVREHFGWPSLVLWGPREEALASAVVAASSGAAVLAPPTAIVDLFGIAKAARIVISGDTGPLHIAAAVGTPVVGLFGPTRAERNGPWSAADVVVARTDRCTCLYERQCRLASPCIDAIAVDEVMRAVVRRLDVHG